MIYDISYFKKDDKNNENNDNNDIVNIKEKIKYILDNNIIDEIINDPIKLLCLNILIMRELNLVNFKFYINLLVSKKITIKILLIFVKKTN